MNKGNLNIIIGIERKSVTQFVRQHKSSNEAILIELK